MNVLKEKMNNLISTIKKYSSTVSIDKSHECSYIHFDLQINDSENKWKKIQPQPSVVSYKNETVKDYNIRIGKLRDKDNFSAIRKNIISSNPPKLDKVDKGHGKRNIVHVRMIPTETCTVEEFEKFIENIPYSELFK